MKKIYVCMILCCLFACGQQVPTLDTEQQLDYCEQQVNRALAALQDSDFSMAVKNFIYII